MNEQLPFHLSGIKAIIVDDHDPIRKAMKRILSKMGIPEVIEVFDGEEALTELSRQPDIDLILCDIYMRKISGFDVLRYVRNRPIRADVPLIVVTGEASKEDIVKASDLGADDYIIKPFQAEAMEQKIIQVLTKFYSPTPLIHKLREGDRAMMSKKFIEAKEFYEEALAMSPDSKRASYSIAVALFQCKKIGEAIKQLNDNIKSSPSFYKNYATLADIFIYNKEYHKAVMALKKELEYNPKQPDRQSLVAKLLLKKGDTIGAIEHFREALRENVKDEEALLGMGQAFSISGDLAKAIYYFRRMRRYHPKNIKSLQAIIKYAVKAGEPRKAEVALREEINSHPDRLDAFVMLARYYGSQDELEQAYLTLDKLFKVEPGHIEGLKVKASLAMKEKKYVEALEQFREINAKSPDADSWLAMAECLQRIKRIKESIPVLHRVLKISPQNPTAFFLLAQGFKKTRQLTKALLLFQAARKAGAPEHKCLKNIKYCWTHIKIRRQNSYKISA